MFWEVTVLCQVWEDVWLYHTVNYRDQSLGCRGLRVSSELHTQDIQDHWDSPIQSLIASNVKTATSHNHRILSNWGDIGQLVSPHASSGHSIKYLKPKSFQKNRNFEIQLLSPVCSLLPCYYTFIILPCVSASDRKVKIVLYCKNLTESSWLCG